MTKDLSISVLMDFYGDLLTPKQIIALDCYYNQDLSLAEIAAQMDISRQGARDFIKKGELHLNEFEEKLGLVEKFDFILKTASELKRIISDMPENDEQKQLMSGICAIEKQL